MKTCLAPRPQVNVDVLVYYPEVYYKVYKVYYKGFYSAILFTYFALFTFYIRNRFYIFLLKLWQKNQKIRIGYLGHF